MPLLCVKVVTSKSPPTFNVPAGADSVPSVVPEVPTYPPTVSVFAPAIPEAFSVPAPLTFPVIVAFPLTRARMPCVTVRLAARLNGTTGLAAGLAPVLLFTVRLLSVEP